MQLTKRAFLLSGAALAVSAASGAFAMGTPSGFAVVGFAKQGDLGEVIVNPYKISPLTAVIKNPKSRSKPSRYSSENDVLIEKSVKYTDFFCFQ